MRDALREENKVEATTEAARESEVATVDPSQVRVLSRVTPGS
jgi:hypothetical protein